MRPMSGAYSFEKLQRRRPAHSVGSGDDRGARLHPRPLSVTSLAKPKDTSSPAAVLRSGDQHRRPEDGVGRECRERLVGCSQGKRRRARPQRNGSRLAQELFPVRARVRGHRGQRLLVEEARAVRHRGEIAQVDPRDRHGPSLRERAEGGGHDVSDGGEDDGGVERSRRPLLRRDWPPNGRSSP